jgi:tetratricopeptide (TPR) repeat protein
MAQQDLKKLHQDAMEWHKRNEFTKAEELYREILRHTPNAAEIHNRRGAALAALRRFKDAAEAFGHAATLQPANENYRYNLANILKEQGLFAQALEQFLEVVRINPGHVAARIQLGLLYQQQEQWRMAMEQFNEVCTLNPTIIEAFEQLGYCLLRMWRYEDAENVFKHVLKISPTNLRGHQGLARALMGLNRVTEAAEWIKKAIQLHPEIDSLHIGLGNAMVEGGNLQEAIAVFENIIKSKPDNMTAYNELAQIKKFRPEDQAFISKMEELLKTRKLSQHDLEMAHFSLGKVHDDIGEYDKAFHFYNAGNRICVDERRTSFSKEANHDRVSALISNFSREFFTKHAAIGHDSEEPVFVIGMPRSGTTLTEQILSSHPQVKGVGEVNFWGSANVMLPIELATDIPYPDCVGLIDSRVATQIGEKYLATQHQLIAQGSAQRIVDKMPQNFNFLGLIAVVFPKAKIIHIQRSAMDTCLSIFFQNFQEAHPYSYDLANVGHYYKEYEHLMQHWREVLPVKLLEISYEDLVANQEEVTRRLIDYVGLPWNERCLQPEKTEKVVRTASLWQARQPVYKTSVARWKRYEKHLAPLKEALGYQGE